MQIELDEHPRSEDFRIILDGVRIFNREQTGNDRPRPVACFLRDEEGQIVGGVQANLWGRSAHIDVLWVDERKSLSLWLSLKTSAMPAIPAA